MTIINNYQYSVYQIYKDKILVGNNLINKSYEDKFLTKLQLFTH